MPRKPRIDLPGLRHHVTLHLLSELGDLSENEKQMVVGVFEHATQRFPVRLHAYCIMSNHLHLAVETLEACLSAYMKLVGQLIAQRLNAMRDRRGPVFDRRFFNKVIQADDHWMHLPAYIHNNPVGVITNDAARYRWSSHRAYVKARRAPKWLTTEEFCAMFGSRKSLLSYIEHHRDQRLAGAIEKRPRARRGRCTRIEPPGEGELEAWPPDHRRPCRRRITK